MSSSLAHVIVDDTAHFRISSVPWHHVCSVHAVTIWWVQGAVTLSLDVFHLVLMYIYYYFNCEITITFVQIAPTIPKNIGVSNEKNPQAVNLMPMLLSWV